MEQVDSEQRFLFYFILFVLFDILIFKFTTSLFSGIQISMFWEKERKKKENWMQPAKFRRTNYVG